jgi:hypothetical protein
MYEGRSENSFRHLPVDQIISLSDIFISPLEDM